MALTACSHREAAAPEPPPSEPLPWSPPKGFMIAPHDLVTVVGDDWSSTNVRVTRWHRSSEGTIHVKAIQLPWQRVDTSFYGVIGNAGLAWGDGLHGDGAPKGHTGPVKHEGDGASPAGAFHIGRQFGFDDAPGRLVLTTASECVDDPKSASYNEIVDRTGSADWSSSEHMRAIPQYALGAFVDHNPKRVAGAGSCIFLHIWAGPESTTVGCTAMPRDRLEDLLAGLGSDAVLVQLPRAEYLALQHEWGLPAL